jgi:hypothetical protein
MSGLTIQEAIVTRNARITQTKLGYSGRGFSIWLILDYGGAGQGFGGYTHMDSEKGIQFIKEVLRVVGVSQWEELIGQMCRVRATRHGVRAIGHIMKDEWFTPMKDLFGV